jgi:hypothetical protein
VSGTIKEGITTLDDFTYPSPRHLAMSKGAFGIQQAEGRDALSIIQCTGHSPTTQSIRLSVVLRLAIDLRC